MKHIGFDQYQSLSGLTYFRDVKCNHQMVYPVLGLVNEAGELAGKVKKIFRDDDGVVTEEHKAQIADEAGDVLWYLTQLCSALGLNLKEVAQGNIKKTHSRMKRGVLGGSGDNR